ncbi:hypothetical protein INS49_012377 [Diaporthe citri]|uniref:uncharacterized protein n=1 Tax=Diaporthe citri TaxID=83186 RepID=UPI001C80577D|nr:uncharacterized protein INS49_012377 [Diaporthe citri]KAG6358858.1 hypothetical protein INS49_012377 [Diaporthe citri]
MGRRPRLENSEYRVQMPTCQSGRHAPLTAQISLPMESLAFLDCDIEDIFTQNVGSRSVSVAHLKAAWVFARLAGPTHPRVHALLGLRCRVSGRVEAEHSPTERVMSITSADPSTEAGAITRSTWSPPPGYSSRSVTWDADPASTSGYPLHAKNPMEGRSPRWAAQWVDAMQ